MIKKLTEKKNDLITRAEEILDKAKTENRELSSDEMTEVKNLRDQVNAINETLALEAEVRGLSPHEEKKDGTPKEERSEDTEKARAAAEERAFENHIRGLVTHERDGELKKAENGAIIPKTIASRIIKRIYEISPILERSTRYNIKGTLELPYYPADAATNITVAYKSEFVPLASSSGKFATIELTGFLAGALTKISKSLINNVDFNLTAFVIEEMAQAGKRFLDNELLNGTENKITGLSTLENVVEAAAVNEITADELIDLQDSVKDAYQDNAIWIMHPKTRTAIRKLKDDVGRYLLNDDPTAAFGRVLLGKPVYCSDNMPQMAAGARAIYYGDMKGLTTKITEDMNIEVLREKYADEHAVGVIGWMEADGKVTNEQMLACLVMAEE
ncbi:MAG: phage major capsid protein [Oscillospiraceae bacterium]|nr:phage major capsid protein [Oscillospiraceae bacterium]